VSDPGHILRTWNWKAALMSSLIRGALFFTVNLGAGLRAAAGAMLAEFALRSVTSGIYGSITQAFRRSEPAWAAAAATMVILPLLSHSLEFLVHAMRGTPNLGASIGASMAMTACTTLVNLQIMRRGVFIVGPGSGSLLADLRWIAVIVGRGVWTVLAAPVRLIRPLPDPERPLS
jgi:hypothetical protein